LRFTVIINREIIRREIGYVVTFGVGDYGVHLHAGGRHAKDDFGDWGWNCRWLLGEQDRSAKHDADQAR
jgi:hypothetical protein